MVDLSSLKGKAQSRVQSFQDRLNSAPATSYHAAPPPSHSGTTSAPTSGPSTEERFAQSTVLNYQKAINRPGPPPRRIAPPLASSSSYAGTTQSTSTDAVGSYSARSPPTLPTRSSGSSVPNLPPRNVSTEVYDVDPVPAYEESSPSSHPAAGARSTKRFSEFSQSDKEELFNMLDQYFEARLSRSGTASLPSHLQAPAQSIVQQHPPSAFPPKATSRSYPRSTTHGSFAQDLLHSIIPLTGSPWYLSDTTPIPPFFLGRQDKHWQGFFQMVGNSKTAFGCVLFSDASIAWYRVDWSSTVENQLARNPALASVEGRYRPRPSTDDWTAERLYEASERYGTLVQEFAERAVEEGRPIGRGECWDVAASALDHAAAHHPTDVPFPSLDRTHGILLYYGKVGGEQVWQARDGYIRAGDIIEWRVVKIREKGMNRGSYVTLGDPEHTAVILSADVPNEPFQENTGTSLAALGNIEVSEQSQGQAPSRRFYDLSTMEQGEVWIYRPVSLRDFVGCDFNGDWDYAMQYGHSLS